MDSIMSFGNRFQNVCNLHQFTRKAFTRDDDTQNLHTRVRGGWDWGTEDSAVHNKDYSTLNIRYKIGHKEGSEQRGSRERWEAAYSDARGLGTQLRCCRGRGWWRGAAPRATSAPCPTRCPAARSRTARSPRPRPRPRTRRNTRVWFGRCRRRGPAETFRSQRSNEKCSPESRSSN